jgi:hypothetical protein
VSTTTAVEMAKEYGIAPKKFRKALRGQKRETPHRFMWHNRGDRWTVEVPSDRHTEMLRVLERI